MTEKIGGISQKSREICPSTGVKSFSDRGYGGFSTRFLQKTYAYSLPLCFFDVHSGFFAVIEFKTEIFMFSDIVVLAQQAAADGASAASQGSGQPPQWVGMMPIFIIFGVMIFFMYRSQKKQAQQRKEMLHSIKSGDQVVTTGGIKGSIVKVKDDGFVMKVADNVNIEVVHAAVGKVEGKEKDE